MNKLRETIKGWGRYGRLASRLLLGYLLALAAYVAALFFCLAVGWTWCHSRIWYAGDPLYEFLLFIEDFWPIFMGLAILLGGAVISYFFLRKPLGYLDQVVSAAGQLTENLDLPIRLPAAIGDVQQELETVRERAWRANQAAREAEQRKNDLVVYLAHDLKTPLTSVIGYLSLLRDEPGISPELRERYTGVALEKAERLEELINEFFDITRFNLTDIALEKETISLTRLLEQKAFEFDPALKEKGLTWDLKLENGVELCGDGEKLSRVFDNLFRNAVSYSYPDTEIALTLKRTADRAVVTVRNSGRHIPPEKLSRLFEQFFRLDSSRTSATGGSGLGLAIAKEIVEKHGGSIRAESPGESVRFTVELPVSIS